MVFRYVTKKIKARRTLFLQILFVTLAFLAMAVLSYTFMSSIVRASLIRNAEGVLDVAETRLASHLKEYETAIDSFAEETRRILIRGDGAGALRAYIGEISRFTFLDGNPSSGIQNFYGYFESLPEGPLLLGGGAQALADSSAPDPDVPDPDTVEAAGWYRLAVEAEGDVVETVPQFNEAGEVWYTYAKSLLDGEGRRIGVVCMEVKLDRAGQEVVSTALNQGGYGMLFNEDFVTMFHPNLDFLGVYMYDPIMAIRVFVEDLRAGNEIFEQPIISYRNEEAVAFFRPISNGWYLGLVTPESQYYESINLMAVTLSVLGISLAAALSGVLVRVDVARTKSEDENKKKSMFLANMSHEIRTPLNAVIGLSELALDSDRLEDDTEDKIEKIHASGLIILNIVNDILDISKLESGKFEIYPTQYDTPSLINDIVTFNILRIGEKPIAFRITVDENLPGKLFGDDLRVKQIFNNLLSNAFKYTESGTVEWRVSFAREGDDVWLVSSVRDTGIGIRPEDVSKLFSDYSQVDGQANRKAEGTGLGLAITKSLVEMMQGNISVESDYGQGSVFHVRLRQRFVSGAPIGKEVAQNLMDMRYTLSKRTRQTKIARANLSYAHVLVVDDIATNLDVVKGMMKPYGMKIDCASSGRQAVEMIRKESPRYHAVFMDHMMPGMDGIEATRIIRETLGTDYARNIPIIALTANAIVGNEEIFLSRGFQDFISKPIDITKLDAVLRRWVRDKAMEEAPSGAEEKSAGEISGAFTDAGRADGGGAFVIKGVDTRKALKRFSGDAAVLREVLRSYAVNTRPLLASLGAYLDAGNLKDYATVAHGIKGSSYGIFAQEAGDAAAALERAANAGALGTLRAEHPFFERRVESLLEHITLAIGKSEPARDKPSAQAPDPALLAELRAACEAFDMDRADAAMERLASFRYESGEKLVAWLREQIDRMAFERISGGDWPSD